MIGAVAVVATLREIEIINETVAMPFSRGIHFLILETFTWVALAQRLEPSASVTDHLSTPDKT